MTATDPWSSIAIRLFFAATSFCLCFFYVPKLISEYSKMYLEEYDGTLEPRKTQALAFFSCVLLQEFFLQGKLGANSLSYFLLPFASILVCLSWVDLRFHLIPDRFQLLGFAAAVVFLGKKISIGVSPWHQILLETAVGISIPLVLLVTGYLYKKIRQKDGLGMGDIKLLTWGAIALGSDLVFALMVSLILALPMQLLRRAFFKKPISEPFAFGPYLAAGFGISFALMATHL